MKIIYGLFVILVVGLPAAAWKFPSFYRVASSILIAILFIIFVILVGYDVGSMSFLDADGIKESFGEVTISRQMPFTYYIIIFALTIYIYTLKNIHIIVGHFEKNRVHKGHRHLQ